MKLGTAGYETTVTFGGIDHGSFLREQSRAAVRNKKLRRRLGFSRGRQSSFTRELIVAPVRGLKAQIFKSACNVEMGGRMRENLGIGRDGRGAAAWTRVVIARGGAVIVRTWGMLVNRCRCDGDGYVWCAMIETTDELAIKDKKTGRVWGVEFRGIIIFTNG